MKKDFLLRFVKKWLHTGYDGLIDLFRMRSYLPRWVVFFLDLFLAGVAYISSCLICFRLMERDIVMPQFLQMMGIFLGVMAAFLLLFNTHRAIIRYTSPRDILRVFLAAGCTHLTVWVIDVLLNRVGFNFSLPHLWLVLSFALTVFLICVEKVGVMLLFDLIGGLGNRMVARKPLLVYGVSSLLVEAVRLIQANHELPYKIRGFVTLEANAANKDLYNLPVFHDQDNLEELLEKHRIGAILINPTEMERNVKQMVADICLRRKVELLSLPAVQDWKDSGKKPVTINRVRIEDLLGRVPIQIDVAAIGASMQDKTILITGAAGSIGSEMVRQIGFFEPKLVLLCDSAETPMHNLRLELEEKYPYFTFIPIVTDVRNRQAMTTIFEAYRPDIVYHAAAYKHVPLMEDCPGEAVLTNIMGTKTMVDLAVMYHVKRFVMISTDKAVNPTNVMGCSKRIAEIYVQSKAMLPEMRTRFITTRFGNVLGSNGSVIPRFTEQIEKGGPVTVTHPDIIRYFMTIPEACRLVLEAGNMGKGGEIFVFDMGDPVKIADLAAKMIRLAGFEPDVDIHIAYTGLRPGEKLYEELLNNEEETKPTHNRKIKIGRVREYDNYPEILRMIDDLIEAARLSETMRVVTLMKRIVPEFISNNSKFEVLDKVTEETAANGFWNLNGGAY